MGEAGPLSIRGRLEHTIEALVPPARCRTTPPVPFALPALGPPRAQLPVSPLVMDTARLDASGRFTSRTTMAVLRWQPGQPVAMTVAGAAVAFTAAADGSRVGTRGELAIPAAALTMAGIDHKGQIAIVAVPAQATLIVHPITLVVRLLAEHYAQSPGPRS
ncbi:hypothetical protein [Actinoplanes subglobosus]|uniref:Uncharacterized protein n=1 Tax=Actinoplanes subglobosus TaxID=1547892 RepID=A0ABV8IIW7_9ACTN